MANYYVDKDMRNGDHGVHVEGCGQMPHQDHMIFLGSFDNCRDALEEAHSYYREANGCAACCPQCHK